MVSKKRPHWGKFSLGQDCRIRPFIMSFLMCTAGKEDVEQIEPFTLMLAESQERF